MSLKTMLVAFALVAGCYYPRMMSPSVSPPVASPSSGVSTEVSSTLFVLQDPPRGSSASFQYYHWLAEAGRARRAHSAAEVTALMRTAMYLNSVPNCAGLALVGMQFVVRLETGEVPAEAVTAALHFRRVLPQIMQRCAPAGASPSFPAPPSANFPSPSLRTF